MDYNRITIEPYGASVAVYCHGTYGRESVLEGQSMRAFKAHFDTTAEALKAYPDAEVVDYSSKPYRDPNASLADLSGLPSTAPGWFDPMDAGESWDSDY